MVSVGASATQVIEGKNVLLTGNYNLLKKKASGTAKVTVDSTTVEVAYDNVDKDAKLTVAHKYVPSVLLLTEARLSPKIAILFKPPFRLILT